MLKCSLPLQEFGLRTTWDLGVIRIKFRVEDGGYELHRRVAYDYDSEYQDVSQLGVGAFFGSMR